MSEPFAKRASTWSLEQLVTRSRRLGADRELVVHGGGNTSTKTMARDHLGRARIAMYIKASGADLATAGPDGYCGLWLEDLLPLHDRTEMTDEEMVEYLRFCMVDPGSRRPSIETLLHAFLPAENVDHTHADAICALTNNPAGARHVAGALGDDVAYIPYVRPGFQLAKMAADAASARAIVLEHHGLVTWSDDGAESAGLTLELVERANHYLHALGWPAPAPAQPALHDDAADDLIVRLRGLLSVGHRKVLHLDEDQRNMSDLPDVHAVAAAGPATADHILRLHTGSLVVSDPDGLEAVVSEWSFRYQDFVERHRSLLPDDTVGHEPMPTSVLVPGLGSIAAGRTIREARVVSDVAARSHAVAARVIDAFGEARPLVETEVFQVDYWPMELYKLSLQPDRPALAGMVVIVTGAASGIGRAVAARLVDLGAAVLAADVDATGLAELSDDLTTDCLVCVDGDLVDEEVVKEVVRTAVRRFGGLDSVVFSAGIAPSGHLADLALEDWQRALDVNTTAPFLLTRQVWPVLERQGIGGSLVYIVTKNAFAPGAGFGAYSASKAAQMQLARVAALEGGRSRIRVNMVNPDAVFAGSRLWSDELRRQRAADHGVATDELEAFYAKRNLLGTKIGTRDVAEAVTWLVSDSSRTTTGCVITVDGGVPGAFPPIRLESAGSCADNSTDLRMPSRR